MQPRILYPRAFSALLKGFCLSTPPHPLNPTTFTFDVSEGFGFCGFWLPWVWFSILFSPVGFWPARHPHRRKRCTECCHRKRNDELDGPQVAANQGAQASQGQADKQEDDDKGEGGGQGAVQRCSFVGCALGAVSVAGAGYALVEKRSGHARRTPRRRSTAILSVQKPATPAPYRAGPALPGFTSPG